MRFLATVFFPAAALLLGGCFEPQLGDSPFRCAPTGKACPDGYTCVEVKGTNVCVAESALPPDMGQPDHPVLSDAELMPTKDGFVFLDGAKVLPAGNCLSAHVEPNNSGETATKLNVSGTAIFTGWQICYPGDVDQFAIPLQKGQGLTVKVKFSHSAGDLDAALADPTGYVIHSSRSTTNDEEVSVASAHMSGDFIVGVWGFNNETNTYSLEVTVSN